MRAASRILLVLLLLEAPAAGAGNLNAAAELTLQHRQALLERLDLPQQTRSALTAAVSRGESDEFDSVLLQYMRARNAGAFFFKPADVPRYLDYLRSTIGTDDIVERAEVLMANRFPEQDGASEYIVQVPDDIDWQCTTYSANPETVHTLNRHRHWVYLAMAYRMTNDARFAQKVIDQLRDWSAQNPPLADPESWRKTLPRWWLMDAAVRADTWVWTYSLLLDTDCWTPSINTLFLYKICQHGEFLSVVTPQDLRTNHALVHGQGLLTLAKFFPEFIDAPKWDARGHDIFFRSMDAQIFDDGCNGEQSPNYAVVTVTRLLEMLWLDRQSGSDWPAERIEKLTRAVESYYQLLSPDGNQPALSDSYRSNASTIFTEANLVLQTDRWPAARPRNRDLWIFGPENIAKYLRSPRNPIPGPRAGAFAMPASGNYVMRSGSDPLARQIIFDAGPKGGLHGHFDLLSFELFGFGRVLVADPGLLRYDTSEDRQWIRSTPAHNTISIDGADHGPLEGAANPGIVVDQWDVADDHVQITAHHFGYGNLPGRPVVARSIWYDLDRTMLIVDWGEGVESHDYTTSFTIPASTVDSDPSAGWIRSTNETGGNVVIRSLLRPDQIGRVEERFTSSRPPPGEKDAATRFVVSQSGKFVVFATLVVAYEGSRQPLVSARRINADPKPGEPVVIRLTREGIERDITFTPPTLQRLDSHATTNGLFADLAFDQSGRLHHVWFDKAMRNLKYSVREPSGRWSIAETIDANSGCGYHPSIAIDSEGHVGVAYTDSVHADLKYAFHDGLSWNVQSVDSEGQTGFYPSLAFSRRDGAAISYYDKTHRRLRLATTVTSGWQMQTIDESGDAGRFSKIALDPARPDASKWAIVYEDTGGARYRYAIQGQLRGGEERGDFTIFNVNTRAKKLGGFTSLAFDSQNRPVVSFYDAQRNAVVLAPSSGSTAGYIRFDHLTVALDLTRGACTAVSFDENGTTEVYYADPSTSLVMRARHRPDNTFEVTPIAPGGGELHVARLGPQVALTSLDPATGIMRVVLP